ncbi:MAG: RNase adapter RapZ [Bacteroidales bacterium]
MEDNIKQAFIQWKGFLPTSINLLPASGSHRKYYRICFNEQSCLGVFNLDQDENKAYLNFSEQFTKKNLPVPVILHQALEESIYFVEDLGDTTLYNYLIANRVDAQFPNTLIPLYKKAIDALLEFQFKGGQDMDYSYAYPRKAFDEQSMRWDANYFKYYFLKLGNIPFDEQSLESDFENLIHYLSQAESDYFLFRDFQSRNIMIKNDQLYFIDFQGGRKGALAYDLASLLFDAKADIPHSLQEELLEYYLHKVQAYKKTESCLFRSQYYAFVYIRIMQAMGAYGLRGFYEKKEHFLKSIPYAIQNLAYLETNAKLALPLPALKSIFNYLIHSHWNEFSKPIQSNLCLSIYSFSFKQGYPKDIYGNGGGFVFDCRGLPNPGRLDQYKSLTGKDAAVIHYLEQYECVHEFVDQAIKMVSPTIANYIERGFLHLMINFACTGGQHRSVYCAEQFAKKINQQFQLKTEIHHIEQEKQGK